MAVCRDISNGVDYKATGLPPNFPFPGGSFANGGAMRIAPIGICFRSATQPAFCRAVEEAIRSSHAHPEAIDGAVAVAYAVAAATNHRIGDRRGTFDPLLLLDEILILMKTPIFTDRITALREMLPQVISSPACTTDDVAFLKGLCKREARPGSGFEFQIASSDMIPCVLWIAFRYHSNPAQAVMRAIAIGGDTDTTACMVGAIVGALHGVAWIPKRWWDGLENGTRGRDWAMCIAEQLSRLELQEPITWGGA
jgi:poly(ADP-ribose) glycohydrolase ARH3